MIYGSVCSGIEAATVAWHPLGWKAAWYSEIEKFPCKVLKHHYPETPNLGDMTKIHKKKEFHERPIDILVGGTPCQSFSVAGLRKGLADPRGNLALVFLKTIDLARPRWVVWENVPGVLSSTSDDAASPRPPEDDLEVDQGQKIGAQKVVDEEYDAQESHALLCFLAGLSEIGYGWAYRIFDAQFAGVPQRRRRIFVVGYLGDARRAGAVLLEREGLLGNPPPRRQKGQGFAHDASPSLTASGRGVERNGDSRGQDPVIAIETDGGGTRSWLIVSAPRAAREGSVQTRR